MIDRFDTVLDEGRKIASALSPEMIFTEVRTAAMRLLRGEHCLVLKIDGDGEEIQFTPLAGPADKGFQREPLHRAIQVGKAVTFAENNPNKHPAVSTAIAERSTLCVPILARGTAVACLYVAHSQVQGLFGAR